MTKHDILDIRIWWEPAEQTSYTSVVSPEVFLVPNFAGRKRFQFSTVLEFLALLNGKDNLVVENDFELPVVIFPTDIIFGNLFSQ